MKTYFYKLGQAAALEELGVKFANPALPAGMQRPSWGLGGVTPQGFQTPAAPVSAPTPPAAPAGNRGTSPVGNAPQPQNQVPAASQPPGPSPAAAPGPASPFRQPSAPPAPSKKDMGIPSGGTQRSLGIPGSGAVGNPGTSGDSMGR